MASKGSCRSPEGLGALMGASLTCGSDATPVLTAGLLPHCAPRWFVPSTASSNTRSLGAHCISGDEFRCQSSVGSGL